MGTFLINVFQPLQQNLAYLGLLGLVFLAVALAVGGGAFFFLYRDVLAERLARFLNLPMPTLIKNPQLFDEEKQGLTSKIIDPVHRIIAPKDGYDQEKHKLRMIRAGLRSRQAYRHYFAAKVILALLLPLVFLLVRAFYAITMQAIGLSVILLLVGFFLPNLYIAFLTAKRQELMVKALPDALDLMVVCVEAGLGLDMTFKRVGDEIRGLSKELSDEFYLTNLEARAGKSREASFANMALRTGIAEVHNLMTILSQTSRFGTSVAAALRVHADAMRIKRRQAAEEMAAKSAVKLVFPLILFIFPTLMIVLAGPAALRIINALFPALGG
jgi:tight adherence protein C